VPRAITANNLVMLYSFGYDPQSLNRAKASLKEITGSRSSQSSRSMADRKTMTALAIGIAHLAQGVA
jgi:hypothetical protein